MTLFKQIALLVSLVFFMIVVTTIVGDIRRSSSLFEGQMQTSAHDMATMLGIAISNSGPEPDVATYETLFNAVFDSGYYSSIILVSTEGMLIHKKDRDLEVQGVPDWFINMVPLDSATGVTQVMKGWVPLGHLRLTLHPGYVYTSLYKNLEANLLWFGLLFLIGITVLWLLLHQLLKPLQVVREQADAIHRNEFVKQTSIPRTVELRSVVEAMNRMVEKVHVVFDDQEITLARYQKLRFEDKLTGLGNRRFFMAQLDKAISDETDFHGSMAVIKIHNLEYVRDHRGYKNSDIILKTLANTLEDLSGRHASERCARLAEDEFALLIPVGESTTVEFVKTIFNKFENHNDIAHMKQDVSLAAGVAVLNAGSNIGVTLAESDYALTQACANGPYSVMEKASTNISLPHGKIQWRAWLEQSIQEKSLFLVRQKVFIGDADFHDEVFVRLRNEDGEIVPAGMFMPMANELGLGENIDCAVFDMVKKLNRRDNEIPVAINLTESVFVHADALVEFNQLLRFFQQSSMKLCVEVSHAVLEQYPAMCVEVAESVKNAGHAFGVDNLNPGWPLYGLQSVRPDYVKVNAKTLYDLSTGEVSAGYHALQTLTKAMDIKLIAVAVGAQELFDHLKDLGVDGMQGNLLGETEEIA